MHIQGYDINKSYLYMVVINQKKNLNFGRNNSPDISLNSNLKRWFSRNIGLWKSNRSYFLDEAQKTYNLCMNIDIKALENKTEWESHYKFTWYPEKKYNFFNSYRHIILVYK